MCGIFGIISSQNICKNDLTVLAAHSEQRGKDSSGLITYEEGNYIESFAPAHSPIGSDGQ